MSGAHFGMEVDHSFKAEGVRGKVSRIIGWILGCHGQQLNIIHVFYQRGKSWRGNSEMMRDLAQEKYLKRKSDCDAGLKFVPRFSRLSGQLPANTFRVLFRVIQRKPGGRCIISSCFSEQNLTSFSLIESVHR